MCEHYCKTWFTLEMTDFKMTFDPKREMCAVQNWAYTCEDTVILTSGNTPSNITWVFALIFMLLFGKICGIKAWTINYGVQLTISHLLGLKWDFIRACEIPQQFNLMFQLDSIIVGSCFKIPLESEILTKITVLQDTCYLLTRYWTDNNPGKVFLL